jgi:hypothetical protein
VKPLSEQLDELAAQANRAKDIIAKAENEARDQLENYREQVRRDANEALETVSATFDHAREGAKDSLAAIKSKIAGDLSALKTRASAAVREFEAWDAENYADDMKFEAELAIDYAAAAIKLAGLSVLDAIAARKDALAKAAAV